MKRLRLMRVAVLLAALMMTVGSVLIGAWFQDGQGSARALSAASAPPGASVRTLVQVPASMRTGAFSTDRYLNIPPNFSIAVYARIPSARFMAIAPNGDLLVSVPGDGRVVLVRPNASGDPLLSNFVTGLRNPHDIVFHTISGTTYVYISESNQIDRYIYNMGDTTAHDRQIVVSGLPEGGHNLKNIALDSNHKLYVSLGSSCNACVEDTQSNPLRGAIYQYNADGTGGRLFARGLRNAEGLAFFPGTNELWAAVNNRDNIEYPFNDGTGNYKQVVPSYVDNHPPEEFTRVADGGNYGWPFCNPNPDTSAGLDNMPFDRDVEFNDDGHVNCDAMNRITKGIQAHSAPLGLLFLQDTQFAQLYRQGALIGLHGSWNRTRYTGYKVSYFPFSQDTGVPTPGQQIDLVTGWLDDTAQNYWGRPVDIAVDQQGSLLISDDYSGTIYKMTYQGTTTTPTAVPSTTPTPGMTPTSGATPTPTPARTPTPTTTPGGTCRVSYTTNSWPGGFTANMTITNTGSSTINGWTLRFTFPGNQQVTQGWNGVFSQSGNQVTITNASYNGTIPANGSVNPGFNGSWSGSNPSPTAFTLNGQSCSVT